MSSQQASDREQLLRRRRKRRNGGNGDEQELLDLAEEHSSLGNSQMMVGDLLSSGQAQLSALVEQRSRMRSVKRLVGRMGQRLGVTRQTMGNIAKRDRVDQGLVFGGMGVVCLVFYLVWFR